MRATDFSFTGLVFAARDHSICSVTGAQKFFVPNRARSEEARDEDEI